MLLLLNCVWRELSPELVELGIVLGDKVFAINNNDIFLVALSSLESPVERTSNNVERINNHKLVMHMILFCVISSTWDSSISHSLGVSSLSFHSLIISDDSHGDSSFVCSENCIGKIIVGKGENGEIDGLFGKVDIALHSIDVSHVWEKESILES